MFASPKCFIFESFTIIVFFNGFIFCLFVFVNSRMRCADVLAENATDGHWVFAKAVFKSTVTGTVTLVRPGSHLCSLQYSNGTKVLNWFESGLILFQKKSPYFTLPLLYPIKKLPNIYNIKKRFHYCLQGKHI